MTAACLGRRPLHADPKTLALAAQRSVKCLCDQQRRENIVTRLDIFYRLDVGEGLETAVAFPAAPNMMDLLLISILGPFGGNQLITALNALYSEAGTTIEYCHVTSLVFASR